MMLLSVIRASSGTSNLIKPISSRTVKNISHSVRWVSSLPVLRGSHRKGVYGKSIRPCRIALGTQGGGGGSLGWRPFIDVVGIFTREKQSDSTQDSDGHLDDSDLHFFRKSKLRGSKDATIAMVRRKQKRNEIGAMHKRIMIEASGCVDDYGKDQEKNSWPDTNLGQGSSAMLSEAIHSLVDTGNQGLLVLGIRQAGAMPDKSHQYGYGRAAYFWSLISALGMFWLGAGVTISHGFETLLHPPENLHLGWELWAVLGGSFIIDGYVLQRVYRELKKDQPPNVSFLNYLRTIKDPFVMAVLLEDTSACLGVLMAAAGIGATYLTGNPIWDSLASISIGGLLGYVAVNLVVMNKKYLLGQSVDPEIEAGIRKILKSWPSLENVYDVQSQWVGPSAFSFKAEVDFDGTYLAAKLLQSYEPVFSASQDLKKDLPLLLAWYAEDVTRLVEREVKEIEQAIRAQYPEAAFIELEPDSKLAYEEAIQQMSHKNLRKLEREALNKAIAELAITLKAGQIVKLGEHIHTEGQKKPSET